MHRPFSLLIWVTNYVYESWTILHELHHTICISRPAPLLIWVTNYVYTSRSKVISSHVTQHVWVTLPPFWCESRTMYMSHELCIWVTKYSDLKLRHTICMSHPLSLLMRVTNCVHESRTTWVTIYIGSSIWVTNSCESRTMYMSHELHWLETRTIALHHASPAMFPGFWVTNYIYESRTLYISHELCWYGLRHTKCMSRPAPLLIWVMNYVHESRTILAQDKSKCAPTRSASNVSWFSSHELGIWVTN